MTMDNESEIDDSDDLPQVHHPRWVGAPAAHRFHLSYESLNETEPLARWLSGVTDKAIDVVLNKRGKWVFSDRSKRVADRLYDGITASLDEKIQAEQEQIDLEQAEREKEVDRLMESWVLHPSRYVHRES